MLRYEILNFNFVMPKFLRGIFFRMFLLEAFLESLRLKKSFSCVFGVSRGQIVIKNSLEKF